MRAGANQKARRRRKEFYDGEVRAALGKVSEVDRLSGFGELSISQEVAAKLNRMNSTTIDRKLRHQREVRVHCATVFAL